MPTPFRKMIATFGLAAIVSAGAIAGVSAQSAPPSMKAAIVQGGCDNLADTALHNLKDVTNDDPRNGGDFNGSANAFAVLTSDSEVRVRLSDLLGTPHSIVIGDLANPVACGEIGGIFRNGSDAEFRIGLAPVGDSGVFGIAEVEGDGSETDFDLYIAARHV